MYLTDPIYCEGQIPVDYTGGVPDEDDEHDHEYDEFDD